MDECIHKLPPVSIIVPVYNTEAYLPQCVSSLLAQTYPHLEIILVDDGSTDSSPALCDAYARQDPRIRVIHQPNTGAALARRAGLALARGAYILFVDGDDWLDADAVSACLRIAQAEGSDCVLFSYIREYPGSSLPTHLFDASFCYDREASERLIHRRLVGLLGEELRMPHKIDTLSSFCMKLYRRETARRGRFVSEREVGTSEDTVFNLYALENCRISYLDACFYHYRKSNAQSITTRHKADLAEKWDTLYEIIGSYVDTSGKPEYEAAFRNRVACCMIGLGLNEIAGPGSLMSKARRLQEILRKPLYEQAFARFDLSCCPLHWKVFFLLCKWKAGLPLALLLAVIQKLRSHAAG